MPVHRDGTNGALPVIDKLTGEYAVNCGSHRLDGVVMLYGNDIQEGVQLDPAKIHDVIPTALYLLGLPIPADMDGQVLTNAIRPDLLECRPIEVGDSVSSIGDRASDQTFTEEEAEAVANRLRDLGYL
jgi:hypothetical protein